MLDDFLRNMRVRHMDEDDHKSISLRYVGRRFDGARLPLDVLGDLPALRDLIAAFAKQEFRLKHKERIRVPRGFDKSISFVLTEIKDGSAMPVLAWDREIAQQSLPSIGDEMEDIVGRAFDRIAKIFDDASNDRYPIALTQDAILALSKLGANIQDGERIEFIGTTGVDGNVVTLDSFRRKNLLTRVRETYTTEFEDVGILEGVDTSDNSIKIRTERFGVLRLALDAVSMPALQFDGNLHAPVEFSLSVALDAHDDFRAIESVHSVDVVRPYDQDVMRCVNRLQELSKIEKGWLGEQHGERLVHLAGMRATQLIFMRANLAKLFRIFPTEDGGVSLEFDKDGWSFAVEVMPDGSLEIDGSSADGKSFEAKRFDGYSKEFFEEFDKMTAVVFDEKN